jgi:hypothetical protein
MAERAKSEQTRALIGTLIEHEQVLDQHLGEYEDGVSTNILDTYFKYVVDEHRKCFEDFILPERVEAMDVMDATRHFDHCLGNFYGEMARKAMSEHVRDVLLSLTQMELREQMNLSRRTLELVAAY